MKNILILGCSFSAGSFINNKLLTNSEGWYNFVDVFKGHNVTVISTPGNGYSLWFQILFLMDRYKKIKQYDQIIIQETLEPRLCFSDILELEFYIKSDFISLLEIINNINRCIILANSRKNIWEGYNFKNIGGLILGPWGMYQEFSKEIKNKLLKIYVGNWDIMHEMIIESCKYKINKICEKNNIKKIAFHFPFIDTFRTTICHQTLKENIKLGTVINDQIISTGNLINQEKINFSKWDDEKNELI